MSDDNRKPIVIAIVWGVIAVVVLVTGIGVGGSTGGSQGWQDALRHLAPRGAVATRDLSVGAGECTVTAGRIDVPVDCLLEVRGFGGLLNPMSAVKSVTVTAVTSSVELKAMIEGTSVSADLATGDTARLTFGTKGGSLRLTCGAPVPTPCSVGLK